jgi:vacuolar-type H+-ATPase subunit E/Vma4
MAFRPMSRFAKGGNGMTEENIDLNRQVEQFLATIREEGAKSCAEIEAKTEAEAEAALADATARETKRADEAIRVATARATAQGNRQMSEGRAALRAELAAQRDALQKDVFALARAKLAAFTQSADYAAWLQKSADTIAAALGKGCTLYARSADLPLVHAPAGCTLAAADDQITLGGLKGASGDAVADDTLEARLAAQHDWFLEHSGLSIDF